MFVWPLDRVREQPCLDSHRGLARVAKRDDGRFGRSARLTMSVDLGKEMSSAAYPCDTDIAVAARDAGFEVGRGSGDCAVMIGIAVGGLRQNGARRSGAIATDA